MNELFLSLINELSFKGELLEADMYDANFSTIKVKYKGATYKYAIRKEEEKGE